MAATQEHPWQVICPVVRSVSGPMRIFEAAMESIHQTNGLRMVGCLGVLHVEQVAPGGPEEGGKLDATVWCDDRRDDESAHPPLKFMQSIVVITAIGIGRNYAHDSEQ